MTAASARQIAAIHTLARALGLDEDCRRAVIAAECGGKRSSAELTIVEAGRVIERLRAERGQMAPAAPLPGHPRARRIDGPWAGKLRALWITGYNLGVVRDRTDAALLAFCERQTGIARPEWWRESIVAARAVEGIKAMCAREAGMRWPPATAPAAAIKEAVIAAQCARLAALGEVPAARHVDATLDDVAQTLGRQLRRALARAPLNNQ